MKALKKLFKDNKGLVQAILGVIISLMVIAVGVFVFYLFTDEIRDASTSNETNDTLDQVEATGGQGFNLMLAAVLISIAMALITIVVSGIYRSGFGGGGGIM